MGGISVLLAIIRPESLVELRQVTGLGMNDQS